MVELNLKQKNLKKIPNISEAIYYRHSLDCVVILTRDRSRINPHYFSLVSFRDLFTNYYSKLLF